MIKRVVTLTLASFVMVACGPGAKISGKQGAAEALMAASRPTSAKSSTSSTPADLPSISFSCPEGGSADIGGASVSLGTGGNVSTGVTVNYKGCGLAKADVGVAVFNGSLTLTQNVTLGSTTSVNQSFKGKVLVQGAFDDFLDADVTQQVSVGDLSSSTGAISMSLKGTIATSQGSYTFDEMVAVTAGSISASVTKR